MQSSSIGSIKPTNRLLVIGARDNGGYGMPESAWYNGKLDDIAIYNRALQPSEVAALAEGASSIDITKARHTYNHIHRDRPCRKHCNCDCTVVEADDPAKPVITLLGDEEITLEIGTPYVEQGVTITDSQGVAITDAEPTTTQDFLINETGVNKVQYDYVDTQGRAAKTVTRTITIVDTNVPVISLVGVEPPVMLDQDDASQSAYSDAWNDGSGRWWQWLRRFEIDPTDPRGGLRTLLRVTDGSVVIQSGNNEVTFTMKLGQNGNPDPQLVETVGELEIGSQVIAVAIEGTLDIYDNEEEAARGDSWNSS